MVWMTGGAPSLARSRRIVVLTVVVNGSACSSQTRSRSSSAETTRAAGVERDVTAAQGGGQRRGATAAESADAGRELGEVEWLGQVVVGAEPESVDPFGDGAGRGQHQHPGLGALSRQPPAYLIAVYSGQVPVQHHHVVAGEGQMLESVIPVEDDVDRHSFPAKSCPDRCGQDFEVFDDQHSHDLIMILLRGRTSARLQGEAT